MCTIANRALFDDLRADAEAAKRELDADVRAASAALDAEYGADDRPRPRHSGGGADNAADNDDGAYDDDNDDGAYDEAQFLRASALLAATTDGAAVGHSSNAPAAPSSPAASSVKSFAVSERHHGTLYFPEQRESRRQRPRESPLHTTSPTRTSPLTGRPWPASPASPPATTASATDDHTGGTSPVSRENPLRVVRVSPNNNNNYGRPPASPITPRSGADGTRLRRRRPRGRSAGSVSSNSSRRPRQQHPGHNITWEEDSQTSVNPRFGGGDRAARAWDDNQRTVDVLGRSGGGGGAAGSGFLAPPAADLALAREEKVFARARARDKRLVDAKRRREEAERARLSRIESQIEGRTQRASVALQRVERKAELERELRLLERQERTERNMQSYWDRRRKRVLKTVSRTSGVYDGVDGDDDVENAERRNGGGSSPRARHSRSAGPMRVKASGERSSVLLGPVGRTGAAAHHDQQLDVIRRISQREELRVGSIITNAALHDARVDSMLDKRAQARQRQADYRAKMARSKAGLVRAAGNARRRNDAALQRFKQRETVAEFARRRARSGLSTAGAAVMASGGNDGEYGNISPRSSVSARSPRSPRNHNNAHATVHSPRYSPRADVPRRSDPRFQPQVRPQPPPTAPAYTLAASQPGSHPPENPMAQYQRLSEGGPADTLPPQQHAPPTDWNPGQNAGPSWTDKVERHRQQQDAVQRQSDAAQRQKLAQRRQQQSWGQEEERQREGARRTAQGRSRAARVQAVLAESYGVPCWYYVDSQGVTQGPFDDRQMRQWSVNGYFTHDLKMKRGVEAAFLPLGEIFPDAEMAFCPGCGPCPDVE